MADDRSFLERGFGQLPVVLALTSALIGAVLWFGRIESGLSTVSVQQTVIAARMDRFEDGRTVNLQRLSKAEEAIGGLKETLAKIDSKVDRLLSRGR